MKLPNAEQAVVDREKITDYLLSLTSPDGWSKARFFTKLKPRWDVHSRGDEDWLGCAREALSSVLGE